MLSMSRDTYMVPPSSCIFCMKYSMYICIVICTCCPNAPCWAQWSFYWLLNGYTAKCTLQISSLCVAQVGIPAAAICVGLAASTTSVITFQGSQYPGHCCRSWVPESAGQATGVHACLACLPCQWCACHCRHMYSLLHRDLSAHAGRADRFQHVLCEFHTSAVHAGVNGSQFFICLRMFLHAACYCYHLKLLSHCYASEVKPLQCNGIFVDKVRGYVSCTVINSTCRSDTCSIMLCVDSRLLCLACNLCLQPQCNACLSAGDRH